MNTFIQTAQSLQLRSSLSRVFTFALLAALPVAGCNKHDIPELVTCNDADALNYNQPGSCLYPISVIKGSYQVAVTDYPLQPEQVGETFQMYVRNGCGKSEAELVTLNGSGFYPSSFCVTLKGYKFSQETATLFWVGAYVFGEGNFEGGKFVFTGYVYNSTGEHPIRLESTSFYPM